MAIDPYERAAKAQMRPREYWGQIQVDAYLCVLQKGKGKVPFDPAVHDEAKACTALTIAVLPLPEQNVQYPVERELIAESSEWIKTVWPSLRQFGLDTPRDAKGKWCRAHFVTTGRTYTNAKGEAKEATTLEFLALFNSEAECRAAYQEYMSAPADTEEPDEAPTSAPANAERNTALEFVKVLAKAAGGNRDKLAADMAGMPMIAKHFTVNSPEVMVLLESERIPF